MSDQAEIILRNRSGRAVGTITAQALLANQWQYHVRRNKRGNITQAIRKERLSTVPLSHHGECKEQTLDSGRVVYALRGTVGSQSTRMFA